MAHTRRRFLNSAGAAVVYKLVNSGFSLQAAAANDKVGVGFIGSGIRGTQLLDDFKIIPAVRPVMVADLYDGCLERAKEQTGGVARTTKRYEDVLNNKEVDAVVIATPDHWHKKIVLDALDAGKHVYVEKPMTWSIEEGFDIVRAVEKSGKLLQVGSQGKTSALSAKARDIVKSGELGKVTMIRMANHRNNAEGAWVYPVPPDASPQTIDWDRFLGSAPRRPFDPNVFFRWRCWWDYSGGVATDLFVHLLTWLHFVMDVKAPKSAVSQGGLYRWLDGRNVPDVMNTIYEYDDFVADMYVHLASGLRTPPTVILGTQGSLEVGWNKLTLYPHVEPPDVQEYGTLNWPKRLRQQYFTSHGCTADGKPAKPQPERPAPKEVKVEEGPSHQELFIIALREGKPSPESAVEGHCAAGAGHLANVAYRRQRRAAWDPDTGLVKES
jgi:predicted dehydrogenase